MNTLLRQEIAEIPTALANTLAQSAAQIHAAAEAIRSRPVRQIIVLGGGTSYCAGLAACAHARLLAGPDGPAIWATPAGDFLATGLTLGAQDIVIAISASGETQDILAACVAAGPALVIGLTNEPDSSLARRAKATILTMAGEQRVLSTTKTFAASVLALHLLWTELFTEPEPALASAPEVAQATLAAFDEPMAALADTLVAGPYTCVFGTGAAWAVALEGALKLKELAGLTAEGAETREVVQGILPIIQPGTAVIAVAPPGSGEEMTAEAARHCHELGAAVHTLEALPVPWPAELAGIQYGIPFYLLCAHLADRLGLDADHPAWRERYYRLTRALPSRKLPAV